MGKLIAVWGSPGSGKTTFSVKLAEALYNRSRGKSAVIVVFSDIVTPTIPVIFPNFRSEDVFSIGSILSKPDFFADDVVSNMVMTKDRMNLGYLGYKDSENHHSFPTYTAEKAKYLYDVLVGIADYVIVDCMALPDSNFLTSVALENADQIIRLSTPDLKCLSFQMSQLKTFASRGYLRENDLAVMNIPREEFNLAAADARLHLGNWDRVNAYADIPVQLYYDGRLVFTQYVDLTAYGVANVTFTLNVGGSVGNKSMETRVNWADHADETRTGNNSVSTIIAVQDFDYEVTVDPVTVTGNYCEVMDVVTSFYILNNSDYDITPDMHNTARFVAYYYNGSNKVVITTMDWNDVVIPAGGTNLVYFKWTVPAGLNGKTVHLDCTVNADRHLHEENYDNNTLSATATISTVIESQTPDTRFESQAPSSYGSASVPATSASQATWTMWEYVDGDFVLKKYGMQISTVAPVVKPGEECTTAVYENGKWVMRSGYGIEISYAPTISGISGYLTPDSRAYTSVQNVVATFPEYRYLETSGKYRTLEYADGSFCFVENSEADGDARVHFIPIYVSDGNYTVSVSASHLWTPAGMIEATRNANTIVIDGTIYDDWYQG